MASVDDNRRVWEAASSWPDDGARWSGGWGSAEAQWATWIRPRLLAALDGRPARSVVELGCGHGRWTAFLLDEADEVLGIDVAERCVEHCRRRFADRPEASFALGDGLRLPMVDDASCDLAFSFDSLVHADAVALQSYVEELARVLAPGGTALLHHSNLGAHPLERWRALRRSDRIRRTLARARVVEPAVHWRDPGVRAADVAAAALEVGLACPHQELVRWDTRRAHIDAITTLVRAGDPRGRPCRITRVDDLEPARTAARAWLAASGPS